MCDGKKEMKGSTNEVVSGLTQPNKKKKRPFPALSHSSRASMVRATSLTLVFAHRATYCGRLSHGWPATARVSFYGADCVAACVCYDVAGADDCVGIRATRWLGEGNPRTDQCDGMYIWPARAVAHGAYADRSSEPCEHPRRDCHGAVGWSRLAASLAERPAHR